MTFRRCTVTRRPRWGVNETFFLTEPEQAKQTPRQDRPQDPHETADQHVRVNDPDLLQETAPHQHIGQAVRQPQVHVFRTEARPVERPDPRDPLARDLPQLGPEVP